jgi:hypothetical protein
MKFLVLVWVLLTLPSCESPTLNLSEEITRQFQSSGRTFVNLAKVLPSVWDKVCILGPYSTSKHAYDTLGFAWPVETHSTISVSDSIALLLFVNNKEIVEFVEHPRRDGDFANLSRQCFAREKATFHHQTNPPKGWPGLFPKN